MAMPVRSWGANLQGDLMYPPPFVSDSPGGGYFLRPSAAALFPAAPTNGNLGSRAIAVGRTRSRLSLGWTLLRGGSAGGYGTDTNL